MLHKIFTANKEISETHLHQAIISMDQTIKPEATLGRLEEIASRLSAHQSTSNPKIHNTHVVIFAADHGITDENISEYESNQPKLWIDSILKDKNSALNSLAHTANASIEILDVGLKTDFEPLKGYSDHKVSKSTNNFSQAPAMEMDQLIKAIEVGVEKIDSLHAKGCNLFVSGEIGVGNTTSAIAMISVLSGKPVEELVSMGRSRLMSSERHKVEIIKKGIELHTDELNTPLKILQYLGGFETAALCGAYIRCAQLGITVVVDGLMSTVAAWIADLVSRNDQLVQCKSSNTLMELGKYSVPETMFCICGNCPRLIEWCFFAHLSSEKTHRLVLEILAVDPLLNFDMKLGQATGSTLVVPILQQACSIYNQIPKVKNNIVVNNCPI